MFEGYFIVVLVEKKELKNVRRDIIPSLCFYKHSYDKTKCITSADMLWRYLLGDCTTTCMGKKNVDSLVECCECEGYNCINYDNVPCKILYKKTNTACQDIDIDVLNKLSNVVLFVRRKSLNIYNESIDYMNNDKDELSKYFTGNIDHDVDSFKNFFRRKYFNGTYYFRYDDRVKEWLSVDSCPGDVCKIIKNNWIRMMSKNKDKDKEYKPMIFKESEYYYMVLPFVSSLMSRIMSHLLVIKSDQPIPSYITNNFRFFINYYYSIYLTDRRNDILGDLQEKIINLSAGFEDLVGCEGDVNFDNLVSGFLSEAFESVLLTTSVYRASYKIYKPELNAFYEVFSKKLDNSELPDESQLMQSLKGHSYSVFTLGKKNDDGQLIIQEINKLNCITKSVLSFAVFYRETPIGVLMFESKLRHGIKHDRKHLGKIRRMLERYIYVLYEANDKHWLARRSGLYHNLHEIKNIINETKNTIRINKGQKKLLKLNKYQLEIIDLVAEIEKYIELNEGFDQDCENGDLIELCAFREEFLLQYSDDLKKTVPIPAICEEMSMELFERCKIRMPSSGIPIKRNRLHLLLILYKNLLNNYVKYCRNSADVFYVFVNTKNWLVFKVISTRHFDYDKINKLLREPYISKEKRGMVAHYGLFIIGMISRHLNGYSYVANIKNGSEILIKIPL